MLRTRGLLCLLGSRFCASTAQMVRSARLTSHYHRRINLNMFGLQEEFGRLMTLPVRDVLGRVQVGLFHLPGRCPHPHRTRVEFHLAPLHLSRLIFSLLRRSPDLIQKIVVWLVGSLVVSVESICSWRCDIVSCGSLFVRFLNILRFPFGLSYFCGRTLLPIVF